MKTSLEKLSKILEEGGQPLWKTVKHIRTTSRGITDLSPEDQKTAIDMINFLSKKGKEAKNN